MTPEEEIQMNKATTKNPKAKGTLHYYLTRRLYCPVKKTLSDFIVWPISGCEYDTFCNTCGNQVNFMKDSYRTD